MVRRGKDIDHALAGDVQRALSVTIDIDDVGQDYLRRQALEDVVCRFREAARNVIAGVFKFWLTEHGMAFVFVLEVLPGTTLLRMADMMDYMGDAHVRRRDFNAFRSVREQSRKLSVDLPEASEITVEDLEAAVGCFIVERVMDQ